ncbi:hypothetical protein PTNB85_05993 [Pyrenophora teres f. teres]|nr:hypothetical protein PTNB85_05993 [Pyrenophora teres f. teres]
MTSSAQSSSSKPPRPKSPHFPPHNAPRVWFITRGVSPIAIALARQVLEHGDYVVAGVVPHEFEKSEGQSVDFRTFLEDVKQTDRWREHLRVVGLDSRVIGQCQAAVAEAVEAFGRIDVLLCAASEGVAIIGAVEELAQSSRTLSLVDEIFEINFFANVNIIKAVLPIMRERKNGHLIVITGITGHLGTPGLGIYCSSQWAIEGYCDSLAYEIAPFNVKMSIVQANMEVNVLTNRITSVPPMPVYLQGENPAPLAREIFSGLLDKLERIDNPAAPQSNTFNETKSPGEDSTMSETGQDAEPTMGDLLSSDTVTSLYAPLPAVVKANLIAETVHALTAIGGHDNPPARHIVGSEGVTVVKEKLKTTSEELEDFVEVSGAVDIVQRDRASMLGLGIDHEMS